jgi:hypothetical protein
MLIILPLLLPLVSAHGFMLSPNSENAMLSRGVSANIATSIDSLRNPDFAKTRCRGESPGPKTSISLLPGQTHTITLALSKNAFHIGLCQVFIHPANNINGPGVLIAEEQDCVSKQTGTCVAEPSGLVTGDMCANPWSFVVSDAVSNVDCTGDCVLRWVWLAAHMEPNEPFETCADVSLDGVSTPIEFNGREPVIVAPDSVGTTSPAQRSSAMSHRESIRPGPKLSSAKCSTHGRVACISSSEIGVCDWGKVDSNDFQVASLGKCAKGTVCREDGDSAVCDWPRLGRSVHWRR